MVDNSDEDVGLLAAVLNSGGIVAVAESSGVGRYLDEEFQIATGYVCGGKLTRKFTYIALLYTCCVWYM